ncbi:ankyrin repeat-containing domain protein [Aspergillus stella-maris]|uniref:ankyrin repeat-containing domain protein n=1 Tax=Aspergillus stella-maris TaxID=1810926 RepID=UPI003CCCC196
MTTNYFFKLPNELMLTVCKYLSRPSLLSFRLTSKQSSVVASEVLYGPPCQKENPELHSAIYGASLSGCENIMKRVLERLLPRLKTDPGLGYAALVAASRVGLSETVHDLLQAGVLPNPLGGLLPTHMSESLCDIGTPLKAAVFANDKSVVDMLLSAGAELHKYTETEISDLLGGSKMVDRAICDTLVAHGLNLNATHPYTYVNLLQLACLRCSPSDHVLFLLENGLDKVIDLPASIDLSPLGLAVKGMRPDGSSGCDALRVLLQNGVQVNLPTPGRSPLAVAVRESKVQAVRLLLQYGANVNVVDLGSLMGPDEFAWHTSSADNIDTEFDIFEALVQAGGSFEPGFLPNNLLERVCLLNHGPYAHLILSQLEQRRIDQIHPQTLLRAAIAMGDMSLMQQRLRRGVKRVKSVTRSSCEPAIPPLITAVLSRNEDAIRLIAGCRETRFDDLDHYGRTALHHAILHGSEDITCLLLSRTSNDQLIESDFQDITPLELSVRHQPINVVVMIVDRICHYLQQLSKKTAEINSDRSSYSQPALMACKVEIYLAGALETAASLGKTDIARLVFERLKSLNLRYSRHCNPLHTAIRAGHDEIAFMLMKSKADIDDTTAEHGYTPLMEAASLGRAVIVRALLGAGARPEIRSRDRQYAIEIAANNGHHDIVKLLAKPFVAGILKGKKVLLEMKEMLLVLGAQRGFIDCFEPLLDDVCARERPSFMDGLLRAAAISNQPGCVSFLLLHGADINAVDDAGRTTILLAALSSAHKAAQVLVSAGCDVAKRDNKTMTPLKIAKTDEMIRILYSRYT